MNEKFGKVVRFTMYAVFLMAFAWVSGQLFFEKQTNGLMASVSGLLADETEREGEVLKNLRVVYYDEPADLEPTITDPAYWKRLVNFYEPLVKLDRDLNVKPALAVDWGLLDDKTWEFRLRPDVHFHDDSLLDAADVIAAVERYQARGGLKTVDKVERVSDLVLKVKTVDPDPLLLQRLSRVFVFPSEYKEEEVMPPIGTGSYFLSEWEPGNVMTLERFEDYWGNQSKFETVEIYYLQNKSERVSLFLYGEADLIDFVPYDAVEAVKDAGFEIVSMPSLQVESIFFNTGGEFFKKKENRQLVSTMIDQDYMPLFLGGYAQKVNQFVSTGIFGFNPDIAPHEYDIVEVAETIEKEKLQGSLIKIHFPKDFSFLGEYLRKQLEDFGLQPIISYMEADKLWESMKNGDADVYYLGFRAELGDSDDFFITIPYSKGEFNIVNYKNSEVDSLIESSRVEMDPIKRLAQLQKLMKIVVEDDVIGVPLFEYQTLYSFNKRVRLIPRIDGFIYFDELIIE